MKRIYASTSSGKPSSPEVTYAYAPDGQVDTTDWEGVSGQIARRYNDRGWLTGIGDLGAPTGFAAGYDYFPDGNVETMESNAPGNSSLTYYYSYDALDRLELASNGTSLGGRYDVQGIRYDRNGNFEGLVRYGKDGETVDDLAYTYADEQGGQSPNRLASISDAVADAPRHGFARRRHGSRIVRSGCSSRQTGINFPIGRGDGGDAREAERCSWCYSVWWFTFCLGIVGGIRISCVLRGEIYSGYRPGRLGYIWWSIRSYRGFRLRHDGQRFRSRMGYQ